MYKTVFHDYVCHFKAAIKNIYNSDWFLYLYLVAIIPIMYVNDNISALNFYSTMLPLILALLLSRMYSGLLPKAFYLCPLSAKDRRDYAVAGMHIRIAIPLVFFMIFNIIAYSVDIIPLYMIVARFILFLTACIAYNVYCQPTRVSSLSEIKHYSLSGNFDLWNRLVQITTMITLFILCDFEYNETLWELILTGILIAAQMFVCIKTIVTFYPQVINQTTYYDFNKSTKSAK